MTASSRLHNAPELPADLPLIVRGLRVGRGQKVLLDDMNWQIAAGQAILITGPNGTGKTSLLRTIAGFIPPMSGEILLGDSRFAPHQPDSPLRLSYYGMADGLAELMTGRDALLQYFKFRRGGRTDPVNPEIDSPEIDKFSCAPFLDTEIRHLSGGQRQRLALSRLSLDLACRVLFSSSTLWANWISGGWWLVIITRPPLASMSEIISSSTWRPSISSALSGSSRSHR